MRAVFLYHASFLAELAVFFRCFAGENVEGADKMAVVVKAAEGCGFGNGFALVQKILCVTDAHEHGVFFNRNADAFFEI